MDRTRAQALCLLWTFLIPVGACGAGQDEGSGPQVSLAFRLESGFDVPESIQHDPARDVYYVSNIAGHPTRADNSGYIVRLLPDGTIDDPRFIAGGRDGVTLNAPKGMLVEGDTLWVADVDHVRAFDLDTGSPLTAVDLSADGAGFLNDLARGADGALYVTDTGLDFDADDFHPGPDRIYRVGADESVAVALEDPDLQGPNGILWDGEVGRFLIASLLSDAIYAWRPGSAPEVVARGTGGYDGLARLPDGRVVASSQDGEAIEALLPDGTVREVVGGVTNAGDIGVDARRNRILVPRLDANVVEAWDLGDRGGDDAARPGPAAPERLEPALVADGLEVPWAMDFAPDGRLFVTERPGRVRIIDPSRGLLPEPWVEIDVAQGGDGGLQGIALAPDFGRTGHVYVMGTFDAGEDAQESRILRFTDHEGRAGDRTLIFGPVPMPGVHRGGGIAFGPDGMLYASLGDGRDLDAPQDAEEARGSIVRLEPDGSTPVDGPFDGSPVWAVGIRNAQGLSFDPVSGALFATEHGPSDFPGEHGWTGRDEVNAIRRGANYGWPHVAGDTTRVPFVSPLASWTPAIAPGGLAVQRLEEGAGPVLWVGALRGERLVRLGLRRTPSPPGWRVADARSYLQGRFGRVRAVALSPDRFLYFTTSNRDSEGDPTGPSDRVYRVVIEGG